jgi:hypothetical protein
MLHHRNQLIRLPCPRPAAGWQEDALWTAAMAKGWDAARMRSIVDGLLAAVGPSM